MMSVEHNPAMVFMAHEHSCYCCYATSCQWTKHQNLVQMTFASQQSAVVLRTQFVIRSLTFAVFANACDESKLQCAATSVGTLFVIGM
jgi:hypothetical protein